jgi:hypothetical protein
MTNKKFKLVKYRETVHKVLNAIRGRVIGEKQEGLLKRSAMMIRVKFSRK